MSANLYSVESLLVGKAYRSKTLEGIIQHAEKLHRKILRRIRHLRQSGD